MRRDQVRLRAAGASDVGRVRQANEDCYVARPGLAFVADGMGGHDHGALASTIVAEALARLAGCVPLTPAAVVTAVDTAHGAVLDAAARLGTSRMGTTVSGVALVEHRGRPHWLVINVGDSRVYRLAAGVAEQVTIDHSEVAELVAKGRLTSEQARSHPARHIITRAVGSDPRLVPDVWLVPALTEDLFVICSDGLYDELREETIAADVVAGVAAQAPLQTIADRLVRAAVAAGGHDNVTAVVAQAAAADPTAAAPGTEDLDEHGRWSTTPITMPRSIARQLSMAGQDQQWPRS